jgi:plasmid maintenance system antidote protein VapI
MTELSKNKILNKKINITVETLIGIAIGIFTLMGMWFALQSDIELAKKLPEPEVSRTEYDLKDQLIRETIMSTQSKVEENSEKLDKIDEKLYEIIKRK